MSGGNVLAIALLGVIIITILALLVAGNLTVRVDPEEDYAALFPAPDSIPWGEGQEATMWLSTNRNHADLRISSVALGIGRIDRALPAAGRERLGRGVGCLDFAVASLAATAISSAAGTATLTGEVERAPGTGAVALYLRVREAGQTAWSAASAWTVGTSGSTFSIPGVGGYDSFEAEVSDTGEFHEPTTRRISVDTIAGTATADDRLRQFTVLPDAVIGVMACSEHDDVVMSLHGEDGREIARYVVDIGPAPAPAPRPTPTLSPDAGYAARRVCVDDVASRSVYLDGGELAGAPFTQADFGGRLGGAIDSADLAAATPGDLHVHHFDHSVNGGSVQLRVSALGASDTQGLDAERVYPVRVNARDGAGGTAFLEVGVWLDTSAASPGGDGQCP